MIWLVGQVTKTTSSSWKVFSSTQGSFHHRTIWKRPFGSWSEVPFPLKLRPKEELDILLSLGISGYRRKHMRHFAAYRAKRIKEKCITWLFPTVNTGEILWEVADAKHLSTLYMSARFWQVSLGKQSTCLSMFNTPWETLFSQTVWSTQCIFTRKYNFLPE